MTLHTSINCLKTASVITIGFGLLFFFSLFTPVSTIADFFFDIAILPIDGTQNLAGAETRLLTAISGGMLAGWGVMFWLVSTNIYPNDPILGRKIILTSIVTWFIIDSLGSIIAGAPFNAALNVFFLIIFIVPVILHKRVQQTA